MSIYDDEEVQRIAALLGLAVINNGGEIRVPYELVDKGLPANHGVRIIDDVDAKVLIMKIQSFDGAEDAEQ